MTNNRERRTTNVTNEPPESPDFKAPKDQSPQSADTQPAFEIFRRIRECDGEKVFWKMEVLRASNHVFSMNSAELLGLITAFERKQNAPQIWAVEKRDLLREFQLENMRLLHNFLAAASTLVDHTRNLVRDMYEGHPFSDEYNLKVAEVFSESEIVSFVKDLRNWMVHRGLLPVLVKATLDEDETLTSSIVLDIAELRSWDKWGSRSKVYLAASSGNLPLSEIVHSYHAHVEEFYQWLDNRMLQIHDVAFRERDSLIDQYRTLHSH